MRQYSTRQSTSPVTKAAVAAATAAAALNGQCSGLFYSVLCTIGCTGRLSKERVLWATHPGVVTNQDILTSGWQDRWRQGMAKAGRGGGARYVRYCNTCEVVTDGDGRR